jgi:hypothetical protein
MTVCVTMRPFEVVTSSEVYDAGVSVTTAPLALVVVIIWREVAVVSVVAGPELALGATTTVDVLPISVTAS